MVYGDVSWFGYVFTIPGIALSYRLWGCGIVLGHKIAMFGIALGQRQRKSGRFWKFKLELLSLN